MPATRPGLHVNALVLGRTRRICAIWRVGGPAGASHPCAFHAAYLLPRRGPEQDWAVDTVLGALDERHACDDGPLCADLATTRNGMAVTALRPGLCAPFLLELSRTALGLGQREWAELAGGSPRAFHATASGDYRMYRYAAAVALPVRAGGCRVRQVVDEWEQPVLRAYAAALLATERSRTGRPL
ncbi:hypothetical protein [Streptomyces sp. SCL15-4]|uniref:hypothetical protein n=1 Tax=Streptomyces sp. SCL15-4 TaxID=2967221 RepID=UPI0029665C71|nr:hypothetical protein [Streptomyces sp. SCL15-4]